MNELSKFQLISRNALENKYELKVNEGKTEGRFEFFAKIKGLKDPVTVEVYFDIIAEDYILLTGHSIVSHYKKIGEQRKWLVEECLQTTFYGDKSLRAPLENDEGWAIGNHRLLEDPSHRKTANAFFLKKMNSTSFELLATEKTDSRRRYSYPTEFRYYYEPQHIWLLTRILGNDFQAYWENGEMEEAFSYALSQRSETSFKVVDEKGHFYHVNTITDSDNIKMFVLDHAVSLDGMQGLVEKRDTFYTYREASELANFRSEKEVLWPIPTKVPFTANHFTIHSQRVVGSEIVEFPIGQWVETSKGIGRIASKPIGGRYELCFEGHMKAFNEKHLHSSLVPIESPVKKWMDSKLVMFKYNRHYAYGFGTILEETPHFYKIRPLSKVHERIADEYLNYLFGESSEIYGRDLMLAMESPEFFKLHGTDLDYIYIEKEAVGHLSDETKSAVYAYLNENKLTESEKIINAYLKATKINELSRDYFIFQISRLSEAESLSSVLDEAADIFINGRSYGSFEEIYNWFKDKNKDNYVFETSL